MVCWCLPLLLSLFLPVVVEVVLVRGCRACFVVVFFLLVDVLSTLLTFVGDWFWCC